MNGSLVAVLCKGVASFSMGYSVNRAWSLLFLLAISSFPCFSQDRVLADGADTKTPVFGTLDYLPKKLDWDPVSVRFELSRSEQYISPPSFNARENNPFKAVSLMRKLNRLAKNPDGKSLQDVLPEQLYARFLEAKAIYAPRDDKILDLRPKDAASSLFRAAQDSVGLALDQKVARRLRSIARGQGAKHLSHDKSLDVDIAIQGYESIQLEAEIACLQSTLQTIETDLQAMIVRANALGRWRCRIAVETGLSRP